VNSHCISNNPKNKKEKKKQKQKEKRKKNEIIFPALF